MTTPTPLAGLTTRDWGGHVAPPQAKASIINLLVGGAPFSGSLTRDPVSRPSAVYPVASPSGFAWLGELEAFPQVDLGDGAIVVPIRKLGGVLDLANELISDAQFNVISALQQLLADGLSRDLDNGVLFGSGPDEPAGLVAAAASVSGTSLLDAVAAAAGEIGDAGGRADKIAASGGTFAAANASTASGSGALMFPGGFATAVGLQPVVVPGLSDTLVYDSSRCYLAINGSESEVAVSSDYRFNYDATTVRIKVRATAAVPAPGKSIRKLVVTGP